MVELYPDSLLPISWRAVAARQAFLLFQERAEKELLLRRVLHGSHGEASDLANHINNRSRAKVENVIDVHYCAMCGASPDPVTDTIDNLRETLGVMAERLGRLRQIEVAARRYAELDSVTNWG